MVNTHNSSVRIGKEKAAITVKQKKTRAQHFSFCLYFTSICHFFFFLLLYGYIIKSSAIVVPHIPRA